MTSILILGQPRDTARLHQILDAAISRLGLTEVRVVAGSELDALVTDWNARRLELRRYWDAEPEADVALIFPGHTGDLPRAERIIWC